MNSDPIAVDTAIATIARLARDVVLAEIEHMPVRAAQARVDMQVQIANLAALTQGEPRVVVRLRRGTYCGPGCPDPHARLLPQDSGHVYTPEHAARTVYVNETYVDGRGDRRQREAFRDGELIVLWPVPAHEAAHIPDRASALRRAAAMVADGIAEFIEMAPAG